MIILIIFLLGSIFFVSYTMRGTFSESENEIEIVKTARSPSFLENLSQKVETFLEEFFTEWGKYCADNPWKVLLFGEYCLLFISI